MKQRYCHTPLRVTTLPSAPLYPDHLLSQTTLEARLATSTTQNLSTLVGTSTLLQVPKEGTLLSHHTAAIEQHGEGRICSSKAEYLYHCCSASTQLCRYMNRFLWRMAEDAKGTKVTFKCSQMPKQ